MATLFDLLSDAQIRLKRIDPGHNEHTRCPKCEGGKTREVSLSVTIDEDGNGFTCVCHRGGCGWKEGKRVPTDQPYVRRETPAPSRPAPHAEAATSNRPDWLYQFFADRNIGARTVDAFGVYAVTRTFSIGSRPAIVFPFIWKGEVVNRKFRPHPDKNPQLQESNAQATLYNVDRLGTEPDTIVFVEGEPDVMALFECGIENAVTLKDGAPTPGQKDDKRYAAFATHQELLAKPKRIVLAGDMDAPGVALREEIARRLGRHRCLVVTWPDSCKDACDTLRKHGPDAVIRAIKQAAPYPIDGLQKVTRGSLAALRRMKPPETLTTGTEVTDEILKLPAEGRLIIVSGYPASGKSNWTRFVMIHTAKRHDRRWAVFSPEMQPWEQYASECAEVYIGKQFWTRYDFGGMSESELAEAEDFLSTAVTMLASDAEDASPTLEWILDLARIAIFRDGVTDLLIDPWNEVEQSRARDQTETDFIGRSLQKLKAFGLRHGCNIWVVVHPTKPFGLKQGEKTKPAGPYDLAGSAHWANKADLGITLHTDTPGLAQLSVWKSRFRRWAQKEAKADMKFDPSIGRYDSITVPEHEYHD
ncbi:MAG TPA: toprim domain-containing protein [Acidiphilium sp.]|nr:toprim domain-containing protein [Acidiphilium sp.]